eukprot:scaffold234224_cov34-Tisochrysis_lutea.AAC.5
MDGKEARNANRRDGVVSGRAKTRRTEKRKGASPPPFPLFPRRRAPRATSPTLARARAHTHNKRSMLNAQSSLPATIPFHLLVSKGGAADGTSTTKK